MGDAVDDAFRESLRISPRLVLALLPAFGIVTYALSGVWAATPGHLNYVLFVLQMYALAGLGWGLGRLDPRAGRWFALLSALSAVWLLGLWLEVPGSMVLTAVPTALAAALVGLAAAASVAGAQTVLLLILPRVAASRLGWDAACVALLGVWGGLGVALAFQWPLRQVAVWSQKHYERAQGLLEEARDQQSRLQQALEDLAQANLQLTRLNRLAHGLRQAADEARAAKEQFVANVSHELRTPLNMIIGFSEMILEAPEAYGGRLSPALLADLAVVRRNAEHLADLVDDVLDLSQVEAQRVTLRREYVALGEIVNSAMQAVRPLFDSKGLYLETDIPPDLPTLYCDRTRVREVLLNLLSNAGRFTERGGVRVRAWQNGAQVTVSVADTGPGIAALDLGKLFQPFQQVDGSIRRRYGGTGLGLSISKRFIELHGGRIWAESTPGAGSTFLFSLPLAPATPASADFARWLTPQWEHLQRTRPTMAPLPTLHPRFVVLEDGDALQRLLTRYLEGIEVAAVKSWDAAVDEAASGPCQALLVNEASAVTGGLHSAGRPLPQGVPVIRCAVPGTAEAAQMEGIVDYLVKPISRQRLLEALERLNPRPRSVLIVDDEPDALRLFRRMLATSEHNYRVLRAGNGAEALAMMRAQPPDVLLLDLVMPEMDGFQLLEIKRQDPRLRDVPVIVISARDPAGHHVASHALTVTQAGGLSTYTLVQCIRALSDILALRLPGGPTPSAASVD